MKITDMINQAGDTQPYDKGTAQMWTDPHISKQLLQMHINGEHDIASRKAANIKKTIDWVSASLPRGAKVLDLGCGPGLYTQRLAQAGFDVTGVDFSASSIEYAKAQAKKARLNIRYICGDYVTADIGSGYDAVLLIYCDFGVLDPPMRGELLKKVHGALAMNGRFVFDALNEKAVAQMSFEQSWQMSEGGFWRETPYVCLSDKLHFPKNKAIVDEHFVLSQNDEGEVYRFWNHYFDESDVIRMAKAHGFGKVDAQTLFAPDGGSFNDDGVTFYTLSKGETRDA